MSHNEKFFVPCALLTKKGVKMICMKKIVSKKGKKRFCMSSAHWKKYSKFLQKVKSKNDEKFQRNETTRRKPLRPCSKGLKFEQQTVQDKGNEVT